jgi:hypothetical protein
MQIKAEEIKVGDRIRHTYPALAFGTGSWQEVFTVDKIVIGESWVVLHRMAGEARLPNLRVSPDYLVERL